MADHIVPSALRRTRFVCVSDTHNASPNGAFKLPQGDVLIHAGDLTNQGSYAELKKTTQWIEDADFEAKIIIAGNHDITLDTDFYTQYGLYFHNQEPQDPAKCQELFKNTSTITYLKHEAATFHLKSTDGPHTTFKIFGSPFSPARGMWAFGYGPEDAVQIWDKIPLDSDIVVTHTPPKYHCDESNERRAAGCETLRNVLWRVRPRLAVCGHVHEGRGVERVRWDLGFSNIKFKESGVERWIDPGHDNNKMSLIDLSSRRGNALENNGSIGDCLEEDILPDISSTSQGPQLATPDQSIPSSKTSRSREKEKARAKMNANAGLSRVTAQLLALPSDSVPPATLGQGGIPPSIRCDLPALSGRLGRQETCIINAAIMASSWPHKHSQGGQGKKFNKPIVVDIDLPVWG